MAELLDLSHTVEHGMVTYRGLPAPIITEHLGREASRASYGGRAEFHIGRIEMVANTGTYLDAPFHRFDGGKDLSELPLASLANLRGLKVSAAGAGSRAIGPELFEGLDVRGRAVLVHTGWAARWRTEEYFAGHPFLTRAAAERLAEGGAALVGIDSYNVDDTADLARPAHTVLLGSEIPVVEHLCRLETLPDRGFRFFAVPVKVRAFGTFPVRAFALVED
ncbi:MAG TPA: cyclase family protein [Pyrinomonadaceae bacterium]|nr:cyclase family protein [Pyrinomonadaceae bacterium]